MKPILFKFKTWNLHKPEIRFDRKEKKEEFINIFSTPSLRARARGNHNLKKCVNYTGVDLSISHLR